MSYREPNTEVIENFNTTAPATNPPDLPLAFAGSAYSVYSKQNLGAATPFFGISDTEIPFVLNQGEVSIYVRSQNARVYERFRPAFFQDADGNHPVSGTPNANGILCKFGAGFANTTTYKKYSETARANAWVPMYFAVGTGLLSVVGGAVAVAANILLDITYGIVPGLPVYMKEHTGGTWINAGVVGSVSGNVVNIVNISASAGSYLDGIAIGISPVLANPAGFTPASVNVVSYLWDGDANFHNIGIEDGDVISLDSFSGILGTPQHASVKVLSQNLLQLAAAATGNGDTDNITGTGSQDLVTLFANNETSATASAKCPVAAYSVNSCFGFTKKFNTAAVTTITVSGSQLTFGSAVNLNVGDIIWVTNSSSPTLQKVKVIGVITAGTVYAVSDVVAHPADMTMIQAWDASNTYGSNVVGSVYADYRAAITNNLYTMLNYQDNLAQLGVSVSGLAHFNDLKQCCDIAFNASNKNLFFVLVDPTDDPATAYAKALAVFGMNDIYEVIPASDVVAVQALVSPHVNAQADPYQAHERIGIQSFNEDDAFLVAGYNAGTVAVGGILTVAGANLSGDGVGIGDVVEVYDAGTDTTTSANVIGNVGTTTLATDYAGLSGKTGAVSIMAGVPSKKAKYAAALLSGAGNRRVSAIFPCSFQALIGTTWYDMPSYFLAAAVAGLDAGTKVSQDQTKLKQALPWSVKLGTNFVFEKGDLDTIAGAGVYVFVQPQSISSIISCRDDLTTNVSALEFMYRSITKQVDKCAKFLRNVADPYVGPYNIDDALLKFINSKLLSPACRILVKDGIVKNCVLNSVTQDPDVVNRILINITVTVFVAGKYFQITLNVVSR